MAWNDLFFDDWNAGSDLSAGATLRDVGGSMDPMTGALISAGSSVLGKALAPSSAGPSSATAFTRSAFDASGWNVSTGGGGKIDSNRSEANQVMQYAVLAVAGILLWRMTRKPKS